MVLGRLALAQAFFSLILADVHILITTTRNQFINLREVEAFDSDLSLIPASSAELSSTYNANTAAGVVIDGLYTGSNAHTKHSRPDEWLKVTYPAGTEIQSIAVYNFPPSVNMNNAGRSKDMKIEVLDGDTSYWQSVFVGVLEVYRWNVTRPTTTSSTSTSSSLTTTSSTSRTTVTVSTSVTSTETVTSLTSTSSSSSTSSGTSTTWSTTSSTWSSTSSSSSTTSKSSTSSSLSSTSTTSVSATTTWTSTSQSSTTSSSTSLTSTTSTTSSASTSTTFSSTSSSSASTSSTSSSSASTSSTSSSSTRSSSTSSTTTVSISSTSSTTTSSSATSSTTTPSTTTSSTLTLSTTTSSSTSSTVTTSSSTSSSSATSSSSTSASTTSTGSSSSTASTSSTSSSSFTSSSTSTTTARPAVLLMKLLGLDFAALGASAPALTEAVEDAVFSALPSAAEVRRGEMYTRLEGKPDGVMVATAVPGLAVESADELEAEVFEAVRKSVEALPGFEGWLLPGAELVVRRETTTASTTTSRTTTTTLPTQEEAAEALFHEVGQAGDEAMMRFSEGNATTVVETLPHGGTMAASRLGDALAAAKEEEVLSINFTVPGTDMHVKLPVTMFTAVTEELAILVAALDPTSNLVKGLGKRADPEDGGETVVVAGAAVIDLRGLASSTYLTVKGLMEPITFTLPTVFTLGMVCAYWDEEVQEWSTDGVSTAQTNMPGKNIECSTTHLSLFGAILRSIVKTLMCMNVLNMLNAAAMEEILQGSWVTSMGASMLGIVFLMLFASFAMAAFLDHRRWKMHHWQDGFLMVYRAPAADSTAVAPASQEGAHACELCLGGLCACCLESDVVRQAVDDIASSWFEHFGEVRTAIETCIECVGSDLVAMGTGLSLGQLSRTTHKAAASMMIMVSRRDTAAHLGMSPDVVSFVLDDEDIADYLLEEGAHSGGVNWRKNESQAEAWAGLREEISRHMVQNILRQGRRRPLSYLKTVLMLCLAENPISALFVHDIFISCKQRVFIFSAEVLGALALSCLFFEKTGMAKGKMRRGGGGGGMVGCDDDEDEGLDLGKSIGRFFVVAMACLLVSGIPVHVLSSLQTKGFKVMSEPPGSKAWAKQLGVWRFQERLVVVLGSLYNAGCTFYIVTFIANIGNGDQSEWSTTGFLALFQDVLLLPFLTALILPMVAQAILALHLRVSSAHEEHYSRQVCEHFYKSSNAMLARERL